MFKVLFLSKIYPACHLDVNGIKPGSNSIMTDKHTTEHSKTASLGWPVCDLYIAHTTIWPEVSMSLIEMPFLILQVNFHTSNDFCDWRLLNLKSVGPVILRMGRVMKIIIFSILTAFL